jgi:hypothetical protein
MILYDICIVQCCIRIGCDLWSVSQTNNISNRCYNDLLQRWRELPPLKTSLLCCAICNRCATNPSVCGEVCSGVDERIKYKKDHMHGFLHGQSWHIIWASWRKTCRQVFACNGKGFHNDMEHGKAAIRNGNQNPSSATNVATTTTNAAMTT